MSISLNSDLASLSMIRNLKGYENSTSTIMQRLSSGIRISSASDNAANLALSEKIESSSRGLNVATRNIQNAISKLDTFESNYSSILNDLQKTREYAIQAANGVYSTEERSAINNQAKELIEGANQTATIANKDLGATGAALMKEVTSLTYDQAIAAGYDDAHIITSAIGFQSKINTDLSGNFILTKDINLEELGTLSDSVITSTFTGELEGNGYALQNVDIQGATADNVAVFATIDSATIQNIGLENASVESSGRRVGGLVAYTIGGASTLDNIAVNNIDIKQTGSGYALGPGLGPGAGGLLGYSDTATVVSNSYSTGSVFGWRSIGGLVGDASDIRDSYSTATVSGTKLVGGLAGLIDANNVDNVYATGDITGIEESVGGLFGFSGATITNSYAIGNVSSTTHYIGGLVGHQGTTGSISNSYATGNIKGNADVGGLIGYNETGNVSASFATGDISADYDLGGLIGWSQGGVIDNTYATGNVTGTDRWTGGLIGDAESGISIIDSYATGSVTGKNFVGGLAGRMSGSVDNSHSTGYVSGSSDVGGFIGVQQGNITNSSWDLGTSNQTSAIGNVLSGTGTPTAISGLVIDEALNPTNSWNTSSWSLSNSNLDLKGLDVAGKSVSIQIGSENSNASQQTLRGMTLDVSALNINLTTANSARTAISNIDKMIDSITLKQASIGSSKNQLTNMIDSNINRSNNYIEINSNLRDTDMAIEIANLAKNQILQQSSISLIQQTQNINAQNILNFY